jgi:UDP-glucose 4,6-dehydratase
MKNVLVTGGCGFIGSHFVNAMVRKHPHVNWYNLDCLHPCASIDNIESDVSCATNYKFIQGKIQGKDLVAFLLKEYTIDTIVHFAAQSHVDSSFENSLEYTYDNVYGTHCLLECARTATVPISRFIHISTDEVYGESSYNDVLKKTESSLLSPTNPYAATKAAAEMIVQAYHRSYGLPVIITRGNNVYGPKQFPEKVIPKFITQLKRGEKCTIHGDGSNRRSFLYVDDVVAGLELVLQSGTVGEIYNVGSPEEYTIRYVADMLVKHICGGDVPIEEHISFVEDRAYNDKRYYICDRKLKDLGWETKVSFEEGIARTMNSFMDS